MDFHYEGPSWKGITPVYNQRNRPICWAIVATDCVTHLARNQDLKFGPRGDKVPPLSTQELIKWIPYKINKYVDYQENEEGYLGHMDDAFDYIRKFGVHSATSYPATRNNDAEMIPQTQQEMNARFDYMIKHGCDIPFTRDVLDRVTIKSYKTINNDGDNAAAYVAAIAKQLRRQPLAAGIIATPDFSGFDGKGIYDPVFNVDANRFNLYHAVMITGFGQERGGDERMFFEIKNSYGPKWADNGYAKVATNQLFSVSYLVNASILRPQTR